MKTKSQFQFPFNEGPSYEGTEEEKARYSTLRKLNNKIKAYNEYCEYFSYLDNLKVVALMISNLGNTYDEDIDVKLIIPKGCLLKNSNLPYPGINIIESLLDMRLVEFVFSIEESDTVSKYPYHHMTKVNYRNINLYPFQEVSVDEEYESNKRDYRNLLDSIFSYKEFENDEADILIFHIEYLKHNLSMAFPSILMFNDVPKTIEYEITSRNIPEVIKGQLKFKKA